MANLPQNATEVARFLKYVRNFAGFSQKNLNELFGKTGIFNQLVNEANLL